MNKLKLDFMMKDGSTPSSEIDANYEPHEFADKALVGRWYSILSPGKNTLVICVDQISSVMVTPMEDS